MKPTTEQVFSWAREAGFEITVTALIRPYLESVAALAYAAGAAAMKERCAKVCEHWEKQNHVYVNGAIRCGKDIRALGDDDEWQRSKDKNLQKLVDQLVHPKDAGTASMGGEGLKND